jgi:hypothetical protein
VSAHTCIIIYVYTVFFKKNAKEDKIARSPFLDDIAPTSTNERGELKERDDVVILKRLMQDLLASSCHPIQGSVKRAGTHDIQSERLEEEKKTSNSKRGARLRCHHVTAFA